MNKEYNKNEINIELHYNFFNKNSHAINFYTRNTCSLAQAEIISYIIKTLFPNEQFDIFSLPPKEGSFKDLTVVKIFNKNAGIISLIALLIEVLLFHSTLKSNTTTADLNTLEIIEKCKELGADEEKIKKIEDICSSYYPKKQKNIFYESAILDKSIISLKPTIIEKNKSFEKEINQNDFVDYLEEIPKEKEFLKTNLTGNIQLSQPFIDKQQQYGRGVAWKGIYYGNDIFDDNNELIVEDGENIFFYMQDDEYKKQILNQEVSFTSGDNIGVIFDVNCFYDYVNGQFGNPRLYIKRVTSQNDNLIQHKKDLTQRKAKIKFAEDNKNQKSLFYENNSN